MKTIQVIRVEHSDGYGMFVNFTNDGERRDFMNKVPDNINERHGTFKTPQLDGMDMDDDWFCAYKSVDQFKEWVTKEEVQVLLSLDFKIYLIEVTNFQVGEFQVIYTKDSIVLKKDISELFIN